MIIGCPVNERRLQYQRERARNRREAQGGQAQQPPEAPIFNVVRSDKQNSTVASTLGDYNTFFNYPVHDGLIGAINQPPTPAVNTDAHIHDPDQYNEPSTSSSTSSTSGQPHRQPVHNNRPRVPPHNAPPPSNQNRNSHQPMVAPSSHHVHRSNDSRNRTANGPDPDPGGGQNSRKLSTSASRDRSNSPNNRPGSRPDMPNRSSSHSRAGRNDIPNGNYPGFSAPHGRNQGKPYVPQTVPNASSSSSSSLGSRVPPPLQIGGNPTEQDQDPAISSILSMMIHDKTKITSFNTPRSNNQTFSFPVPISPLKPTPVKKNKKSTRPNGAVQATKSIFSSPTDTERSTSYLSEESEEEEEITKPSPAVVQPPEPEPKIEPPPHEAPESPMRSSDDSSSSGSDSEESSSNSSEGEEDEEEDEEDKKKPLETVQNPPPVSPKHDLDNNNWRLANFFVKNPSNPQEVQTNGRPDVEEPVVNRSPDRRYNKAKQSSSNHVTPTESPEEKHLSTSTQRVAHTKKVEEKKAETRSRSKVHRRTASITNTVGSPSSSEEVPPKRNGRTAQQPKSPISTPSPKKNLKRRKDPKSDPKNRRNVRSINEALESSDEAPIDIMSISPDKRNPSTPGTESRGLQRSPVKSPPNNSRTHPSRKPEVKNTKHLPEPILPEPSLVPKVETKTKTKDNENIEPNTNEIIDNLKPQTASQASTDTSEKHMMCRIPLHLVNWLPNPRNRMRPGHQPFPHSPPRKPESGRGKGKGKLDAQAKQDDATKFRALSNIYKAKLKKEDVKNENKREADGDLNSLPKVKRERRDSSSDSSSGDTSSSETRSRSHKVRKTAKRKDARTPDKKKHSSERGSRKDKGSDQDSVTSGHKRTRELSAESTGSRKRTRDSSSRESSRSSSRLSDTREKRIPIPMETGASSPTRTTLPSSHEIDDKHSHGVENQPLLSSQDKFDHGPPSTEASSGYVSLPNSEHDRPSGSSRPNSDRHSPHDGFDHASTMVPPMASIVPMPNNTPHGLGPNISSPSQPHHKASPNLDYYGGHSTVSYQKEYRSPLEREIKTIDRDHMIYLVLAKDLKHSADSETDRFLQSLLYMDAVLYFIMTGESMEMDTTTMNSAITMYKDTLRLIQHVTFTMKAGNNDERYNKLSTLSLRCQSVLYLKMWNFKSHDRPQILQILSDYPKCTRAMQSPADCNRGPNARAVGSSPSALSPTPSPAGSVESEVGSQSSGYTTSTEGHRPNRAVGGQVVTGHTPPHPHKAAKLLVEMPMDLHNATISANNYLKSLVNATELWVEGDRKIEDNKALKQFFIEIDRVMGPIHMHSKLVDLVDYVRMGLNILKSEHTKRKDT